MDYVVGSVAALISGNVTPNRPKLVRKALTPMKHQPSPNVTPKSQQVEDRSIFLSPSVQKKKAIVKKSPKRIFQNPDLDETNEEDGSSLTSPKAEKVKKHLKDDLESSDMIGKSPKSLKNKRGSDEIFSSSKKVKLQVEPEPPNIEIKESKSPKKQKQKTVSESSEVKNQDVNSKPQNEKPNKSKKQRMQKAPPEEETPVSDDIEMAVVANESNNNGTSKKKNKKRKKKGKQAIKPELDQETKQNGDYEKEKNNEIKSIGETNKKKKKKGKKATKLEVDQDTKNDDKVMEQNEDETEDYDEIVNPNAITNEDTDSEHESDDEIDSEDEVNNKEVLESAQAESSDEENEEEEQKEPEKKIEQKNHVESNENDAEVVKRTLFVGNVPFSAKCKKEIKKIFSKYGQIETIRIRTVPVKDARVTPKMAVIKNELHPDRTTVNVYVKFSSEVSVAEALAENNTVLNDHHLRVTRSDSTGSHHDPKCSVFIGNIPFGLEDEGLRAKFEQCGEIETVRIVRDKKTNAGKGFGYVNFASKDGVELALGLTEEDLTIKNRILRVKRVTQTPGKQKGQGSNQRFNRGGTNQGRNHTDGERKPFDRNNRDNTQDRKQFSNNKSQGRSQGLRARGDFQGRSQGGNFQGRNQGGNFQGRSQGGNFQGRNQGGNFQGKTQGGNFQRRNQDDSQGSSNYQGKNQQDIYLGQDGAHRRILKRKTQDNEGPPNKVQKESTSEPEKREKKPKKEFVGMTAEKKKKHKFDKGQKKKKALSEILAKK